jgi:hypothetical protein
MDNERLLASKELRDKRIAKLEHLKNSSDLFGILAFIANILINIEFRLNIK